MHLSRMRAYRGKTENPALALWHHRARRGLHAEERPLQVDAEHSVPVRLVYFKQRPALAEAGAVDEDIEPAELLGTAREEALHFFVPGYVGRNSEHLQPALPQAIDHTLNAIGQDVIDDDASAGLSEPFYKRLANTPAATCNQDYAITKGLRFDPGQAHLE
jgi:hypothetical protein